MKMQDELTSDIRETATVILWEFGRELATNRQKDPKHTISVQFLARSLRQLDAIQTLFDANFVPDVQCLFRSLLERYLLYTHLCESNEFAVFDDWCFKKAFELENRIRSSRDLKQNPGLQGRTVGSEHKDRYARVRTDDRVARWRRPDMEEVAKKLELKFFYDAGYDHASSYVHPVSTDGYNDFLILMNRESEAEDEGASGVLGNARLTMTLHLQHFLNQPEYNWRAVIYDLIDALRANCGGESRDYSVLLTKVAVLHGDGNGDGLLERAKSPDEASIAADMSTPAKKEPAG